MAETKQPAVAFYGKVRIPTIGHKKAIDKLKNVGQATGGKTYIVLSDTSHPLSSDQKNTHAEKLFNHPVMTGDDHSKNLFSFLSHVNKSHDHIHLVAGSDRAPEYEKTLKTWNGKKDSTGKAPFHFKSWKVHQVEGERTESKKHPTKMNSHELETSVSATKLEGLAHKGDYHGFKAYHPGMDEKHVKGVYDQIRKAGPKPVATIKKKLKEQLDQFNEELTRKQFSPMVDSFVKFASDKLGIKSLPNITYKASEDKAEQPSFGGYNPNSKDITISTKNRHPMDIFRTLAHELVHHKQKEEDRIGHDVAYEGSTGSDIENEANAEAGKLMRWFGKDNPNYFNLAHMTEEYLSEGIHDPATHRVVFLAGGPGSGKDFVMGRTLHGHGMTEINSDHAYEYLLNKHNLDLKMPENQAAERNIVRGRAKNLTDDKKRLAIAGRKGIIVNGTADDPEKMKHLKSQFENLGYKSMMVFVNTSNKTSQERNNMRGVLGGRTVPEKIRNEKWHASQKAKKKYSRMFGAENFLHVDNSEDYNAVSPEKKAQIDNDHLAIFKHVRNFASTPVDTPQAVAWRATEAARRGMTLNKTTPIHQGSRVQKQPSDKAVNEAFSKMLDPANNTPADREWGKKSTVKIYKKGTPGETADAAPGPVTKVSIDSGFVGGFNETVQRWIDNPKTKARFTEKYGALAEQKIIEVAGRLNTLQHTSTNVKPKRISELFNATMGTKVR